YTPSGWACTGASSSTPTSVMIDLGQDVTCTLDNDDRPTSLTLTKIVDNAATGGTAAATDWTLAAAGPTTGITGATGSPGVTDVAVDPGAYTLTETGGPPGYTPSGWACAGAAVNGSTVTVGFGQDVTCRIVNDDQQAV